MPPTTGGEDLEGPHTNVLGVPKKWWDRASTNELASAIRRGEIPLTDVMDAMSSLLAERAHYRRALRYITRTSADKEEMRRLAAWGLRWR